MHIAICVQHEDADIGSDESCVDDEQDVVDRAETRPRPRPTLSDILRYFILLVNGLKERSLFVVLVGCHFA